VSILKTILECTWLTLVPFLKKTKKKSHNVIYKT
jgi:hypothetical protein